MNAIQALYRVPEVAATMRELSKEMMKAGILEEMIEDTFEGLEDTEELEEEADNEIQNVRYCMRLVVYLFYPLLEKQIGWSYFSFRHSM